jgi:hypothetical protein
MRIRGLVGASEPAFCTRDRRWLSLDSVVMELCSALEAEGIPLSPFACKAAVQVARQCMLSGPPPERVELVELVRLRLRGRGLILPAPLIDEVLARYARAIVELDIVLVQEIGT